MSHFNFSWRLKGTHEHKDCWFFTWKNYQYWRECWGLMWKKSKQWIRYLLPIFQRLILKLVRKILCSSHRSIFSRESMGHWFGHTLTNQRQSALIPSSSLELFLLALFGSRHEAESTWLAVKKGLYLVLSYRHSTWKIFTEDNAATSYTHKRTSPVACHTSYLLQWHTFYKLKNHGTPGDTKKNLFSLWIKFTSAIRINLSLLGFKEVS